MNKQVKVSIDETQYLEIREFARKDGMAVDEWIAEAAIKVKDDRLKAIEDKLRAVHETIEKASQYNFPAPDIEVMLEEIEAGCRSGWPEELEKDPGFS